MFTTGPSSDSRAAASLPSLVFATFKLQSLFLHPIQAHRNLSQLPNFAFSVPLAYFLLSQQADLPEQELSSAREQASLLIRQALIMFPGGGCGVSWQRLRTRPGPGVRPLLREGRVFSRAFGQGGDTAQKQQMSQN